MGDMMGRWHLNDLKKFVGDDFTKNLKTTFNTYEKKVQDIVKDIDVKGKEAKKKGEVQIDKWVKQLKKSRTEIEKRVSVLVNDEAKKLSKSFGEVVKNLRGISAAEMSATKPAAKKAKSGTAGKKKASGAQKKSKSSSRERTGKVVSEGVVTASAEPSSANSMLN